MEEHVHTEECDHGHEEELSTDEVVDQNDILLNALIDLLISKGLITEEEYNKRVAEFATVEEDDDSDGEIEEPLGEEEGVPVTDTEQGPEEPEGEFQAKGF
ncbi:MAG: hypothetical protein ACE5FT_00620 [Candidatus Nanoarchaeia archaeon]